MLGKLFSKKEKPSGDIESLKQRFNQINGQPGVAPAQTPAQPAAPQDNGAPQPPGAATPIEPQKVENPIPPQPAPVQQSPAQANPAAPVQPASTAQPEVQPTQPEAQVQPASTTPAAPTDHPVAPPQPSADASATSQPESSTQPAAPAVNPDPAAPDTTPEKPEFEVVEVIEGGDDLESVSLDSPVENQPIQDNPSPDHKAPPGDPQKMGATKISKYLDNLKDELDDTKLTSLIIQQVKELIEIDQNLNNKIRDLEDNLKKEAKGREKLKDQIDKHYDEFKKSEKNMDKFIALYEVVTNQFNPFIEQPKAPEVSQDLKQEMNIPEIPKSKSPVASEVKPEQAEPEPVNSPEPAEEPDEEKNQTPPVDDKTESPEKVVEELSPELHFETKDGQTIKNLSELVTLLKGMSSEVFSHHVTKTGNDFSAWVHHVLKNEELAKELGPLKNRLDMIRAIMDHI